MRKSVSNKGRRKLMEKMAKVFGEDVKVLPKGMQRVLLDDMVTAFQNRLKVLSRAQRSQEAEADIRTVTDHDFHVCPLPS
jgi:hypothetical protein